MPCATHRSLELEPSGFAPAQARRVVRSMVAGTAPAEIAHTAELLVSELVTNAITHGSGPVRVAVDRSDDELTVTVTDDEPAPPQLRPERLLAGGGRGVRMVESLSSSWGVVRRDDGAPGKQVWFRLRLR